MKNSSSSRQVISWLPGPGIYPAAVEARERINFNHLMVVDGVQIVHRKQIFAVFQQGKRQRRSLKAPLPLPPSLVLGTGQTALFRSEQNIFPLSKTLRFITSLKLI